MGLVMQGESAMSRIHVPSLAVVFFSSLLLSMSNVRARELYGSSVYGARSQGTNAARDLVGFCRFLDKPCNEGLEGAFFITPSYGCSMRPYRIAGYFFNTDILSVTGSKVAHRSNEAFLADYFGLSPSFDSTIAMKPSIESALLNCEAYACCGRWYARVYLPLVSTHWSYDFNECTVNNGTDMTFPAGYMAGNTTRAPLTSFIAAMRGHTVFGDASEGLLESIVNGPRKASGLAGLCGALGCHIIRNPCMYVGLSIVAAVPTGTRIHGPYFFQPVVGNGHHGELGIGFDGRVLAWEVDGCRSLSFYGSVRATHLFATSGRRSFDFTKNGFASRYLLLKEFDTRGFYNGKLVSASTITTLPCTAWSALQCDIVAMIGYLSRGLEIDVGYNAWIRTREHVHIRGNIPDNRYGIKGIQNVTNALGNPSNTTQSTATIYGNLLTEENQIATADSTSVYIKTADLDPCSAAATSACTQKFFAHVAYAWTLWNGRIEPYLGCGSEIEFEGIAPERYRQANKNAVAQWGIWLKAGGLFM